MTGSASPTSATTSRMARFRTPPGSRPHDPVASLVSGMPNSIIPPRPSSAASAAAFPQESRMCWTTPGIEPIGTGLGRTLAHEHGSTSRRASTDVSATSRRRAGVDGAAGGGPGPRVVSFRGARWPCDALTGVRARTAW